MAHKLEIFRSETFRTPLGFEKELGLWVDRTGEAVSSSNPGKLRILGLYAAVYIEKGEGVYILESSGKKSVRAGDVMIVYPRIPTMYYPKGEWKSIWIVWGGPESQTLDKMGYLGKPVFRDKNESVRKAFMSMLHIKGREDMDSILERKRIVIEMILELHRASMEEDVLSENKLVMERIIAKISENPSRDYSIEKLAAESNISLTHFRRLFIAHTGNSPKEFILSMKMSRAKQMLSEGKSIKETAEECGFEDVFYFMRSFKKMTGITAGKFSGR
ncbi:MAG TPA: hypothetical protein DCZ94_13480 [Lentisphaeria bacterium]|nr:MAG: hypothetical protein A2X48_09900 [Lentisphaerae bacterium GWF2_49_21]HBC87958.1 hypothetical protein [Lentisphaeria bacterium]